MLDHRRGGHRSTPESSRGSRESSQMHADRAELPLVGKEGDDRGCCGRELHDLKNPSGAPGFFCCCCFVLKLLVNLCFPQFLALLVFTYDLGAAGEKGGTTQPRRGANSWAQQKQERC